MSRCGLGLCRRGLEYLAEARNISLTLGKSRQSSPNLAVAFVMLFISVTAVYFALHFDFNGTHVNAK